MKKLALVLFFFFFSLQLSVAQYSQRPNALSIGVLANDYYSPFKDVFFSAENFHYVAQVAYHRNLYRDFLNLEIPFRMGSTIVPENNFDGQEFTLKQALFSVGALAQIQYFKKKNALVPYFLVGGSYTHVGEGGGHFEVPLGIGLDIKTANGFYFQLKPEYRVAFKENRNNWNFYAGIKFFVGPELPDDPSKTDKDGDGVVDLEDRCPETPGLVDLKGCPDKDTDGVPDLDDLCPDTPGLAKMNGCPDTDEDGITDASDDCPTEAGPEENKGCPYGDADGDGITDNVDRCKDIPGLEKFSGCPDTDGDGLADPDDECPETVGIAAFAGCPDSDSDGLKDSDDECPTEAGPISNKGCPKKIIDGPVSFVIQNIQFETNSASLKSTSFEALDEVANILLENPEYQVTISGHTDSEGNKESNLALGKNRATACADYLISKGIEPSRIAVKTFGEDVPIADNSTPDGMRQNRRVEFKVFKK